MKRNRLKVWIVCALGLMGILFALVGRFGQVSEVNLTNTAATLGLISAVALGIERVLEAMWTMIASTKGGWWPLSVLNGQVTALIDDVDSQIVPIFQEAAENLKVAKEAGEMTREQVDMAWRELEKIRGRIEEFRDLAPNNQQVNLYAVTAFQGINYVQRRYPRMVKDINAANQAITGLSDFVATIKDNPGKKLLSMYAGSVFGMLITAVIGLDVFQATGFGAIDAGPISTLFPSVGVALTGILVGLGSNPTHDVIRSLQEIKQNRKLQNTPSPGYMMMDFTAFDENGNPQHQMVPISTYTLRK